MTSDFNFENMLTGNLRDDAAITSDALRQIREVMSMNKQLANKVHYIVKDKSQNEQARYENLLGYVLDVRTLEYLHSHQKDWLTDPSLFDDTIKSSSWALFNPGTRAICEYNLDSEQDHI